MRRYFRNDRKCESDHLSRMLKYMLLWVVLFGFISVSVYFLFPENRIDHDRGVVSTELTQVETIEGNVAKTSYVNEFGQLTYAIDKHYATLVQKKDAEGRLLEEHYLDEDGEPTDCWGYFGIAYEHREKEDVLTYLDAEGNTLVTQSGYAVIVRSLDSLGQALDDMYYDDNMNPVMCTGGYYGVHRERDERGFIKKMIYLDVDKSPICIISGFAQEERSFDNEGRVIRKFYFDVDGNPVCLQSGQSGEAYTYDEYDRVNQVTYLDKDV